MSVLDATGYNSFMPRVRNDLTGQRFGRLLVLEYSHTASHSLRWRCLCDCGTEKIMIGAVLRRGAQSCGCLKRELLIARNLKHGETVRGHRTPTYNSWHNMIRRTTNPDYARWADWGGRGIAICERWRDFRNFLADMGEKPPGTTLDRIDNNGDYEPANCRWATPAQQARNQRRAKLDSHMVLEIQRLHDQGLPIGAIAQAVGMGRHTVGTVCTVIEALIR